MGRFKAIRIDKTDSGTSAGYADFEDAGLMDGDVTVRVLYSTLNYKDALAITGSAPVVRRFPMIPGIDFAGVVEASAHADFKAGDTVILNGWGVGETHLGGLAQVARVSGDWLIPLTQGVDPLQAMAIGTAGYTAALCILALERHGLTPASGPALVTGAAGGVGSVAVALLAAAGWRVAASTGRVQEEPYLRELGASEIVPREELSGRGRPLNKERWAAAIDSVGSTVLANTLSHIKADGAVAACGLAGGMDLPATVAPFILRGVALLGVNSVTASKARRIEAWERLSRDFSVAHRRLIADVIPLNDAIARAPDVLAGKVRGRLVVEIPQ